MALVENKRRMINVHRKRDDGTFGYIYGDFGGSEYPSLTRLIGILSYNFYSILQERDAVQHVCDPKFITTGEQCPCSYDNDKRYIYNKDKLIEYLSTFSDGYPIKSTILSINNGHKWDIYNIIRQKPQKCNVCNTNDADFETTVTNDQHYYCCDCVPVDVEHIISSPQSKVEVYLVSISKSEPTKVDGSYCSFKNLEDFKSKFDLYFKPSYVEAYDNNSMVLSSGMSYDDYYPVASQNL